MEIQIQKNATISRWKKPLFWYVALLLGLLLFGAGFICARWSDSSLTASYSRYQADLAKTDLPAIFTGDLAETVWGYLKSGYLHQDKIDNEKMYYSALEGLVDGIGDPYTVFLDPDLTKSFDEDINGQFQGIGAQIGKRDGVITIIAPIADSPAEKAGLKAGDKIYAIDQEDATSLSIDEAVKRIKGPKGTKVTLLVLHEGETAREITITRDVILMKSVVWDWRADGLLYVEVSGFNSDSAELFENMISEMKSHVVKGIIVDLRNNPGGLLDQANYLTSKWLATGELIVRERFSDTEINDYRAEGKNEFFGIPTVLLINGGSASGSEIMAGALQDYGYATLIGEKSYGKGSVQEMKRLPDGSSLKMTIAEWLTPKENFINGVGVMPDVEVTYTNEDYEANRDPQMDKAIELLLQK
jgi:carboxyl-terminal processing protease